MKSQLENLIDERDEALRQLSLIKQSTSWRITAPLRLAGHLVNGRYGLARLAASAARDHAWQMLPERIRSWVGPATDRAMSLLGVFPNSENNIKAWRYITDYRNNNTKHPQTSKPRQNNTPIDICVVVYKNYNYLRGFLQSILNCHYDLTLVKVYIHNNNSDLVEQKLLQRIIEEFTNTLDIKLSHSDNIGFGRGQHVAITSGQSDYILVSNIDLTFDSYALSQIVNEAICDNINVAAWELRQKPFEHPKYYDPVTKVTMWNSHACTLLRRSAYISVGGYDPNIFMYGEDVELSYRLRNAGYILKYVPKAFVYHYTYSESHIKPLQYEGGIFANIYLRMKFGTLIDRLSIVAMIVRLLLADDAYHRAKFGAIRQVMKFGRLIMQKQFRRVHPIVEPHPFRGWDYEVARDGAFVSSGPVPADAPLVSIITRTVSGREHLLKQAMASVKNQTYINIEHIIVQDGGNSMEAVITDVAQSSQGAVTFYGLPKIGRSAAGNYGVLRANGKWCVFLDDDDLLFADHVETLMQPVNVDATLHGAISLAWQIETEYLNEDKTLYREMEPAILEVSKLDINSEILRRNLVAIQSVLFLREKYLQIGGMPEDLDVLEDWVLWAKYFQQFRTHKVNKVTSMFRIPSVSSEHHKRLKILNHKYGAASARIQIEINKENNNRSA